MKLIYFSILIVLSFISTQNQPAREYYCVTAEVTDAAVLACDVRDDMHCSVDDTNPNCDVTVFPIPLDNWSTAWPKPMKNQLLKMRRADGVVTMIDCSPKKAESYDDARHPLNAGMPEGCDGGDRSELVRQLLKAVH